MFAPVPLEPVFTEERRIVRAPVPRFFEEVLRFLRAVFSTFLAVFVGGGGGAGGGTGSGILGADVHISILYLGLFRFEEYGDESESSPRNAVRSERLTSVSPSLQE